MVLTAAELPPSRILHLEDSDLDAELIRTHLARGGVKAEIERVSTRDGFTAALERGGFDLVLADFNLPDFDGMAALSILQRMAPHLPFIFVSGALGEETAIDSLKLGATDYVVKQRLERLPLSVRRALAEAQALVDRKQADEALKRLNETLEQRVEERTRELRAAQESLAVALDAARMGIWDLDLETEQVRRSLRHDQMFGHSDLLPEWTIGTARGQIVPEDRDAFDAELTRSRASDTLDAEWHVRWPDGSIHCLAFQGRSYDAQGRTGTGMGRAVRMAGVVMDVTERRQIEQALRQGMKMEAVGQLTSGIAHDFNNLLTAILGNLELIQRRSQDERMQRLAGAAIAAAERGATLTQQLLAFSRKQRLAPQPTDLSRVVLGMQDLLERSLGGRVGIATEFGAGLWSAMSDPQQIELVLLNLAINARDAMPDGGTLRIAIHNRTLDGTHPAIDAAPGDYVGIIVSDSGTGMSPEVVARAFEPFFTTKETGKGSGLGLSMIYGVVRQSGGAIRIDSRPGDGTRVEIYLPRADGKPAEQQVDHVAQPVQASEDGQSILLVDDDPLVREVSAALLRDAGYQVTEARDGPEAVAILSDGVAIDLLLVDYAMPGMTGLDVARRAASLRPGLPVLFATGYVEGSALDGLSDPNSVIKKPFKVAELTARIGEFLKA